MKIHHQIVVLKYDSSKTIVELFAKLFNNYIVRHLVIEIETLIVHQLQLLMPARKLNGRWNLLQN
ncbi:hypothetical protein T01_6236 [Trichinella spiralis]|uniref:Uncharacterized protein n=1 Tax=Trichinella spiralis TaxID=6334 RepID=A0A0V1BY49_TRISP|nr:hypothetical protein T01_6236 [Trichinella spiralis]